MADMTKTLTAVGAAVVVGTGALVTYNALNKNNNGIDWSQYDLNIPTLDIPELNIPELNIPELDMPKLDFPDDKMNLAIEDLSRKTSLQNDEIKTENLSLTALSDFKIGNEDFKKLGVYVDFQVEELNDPSADMEQWIKFMKQNKKYFADQRTIESDTSFNCNNKSLKKWIEIYKNYKSLSDVKYVPIKNKFRMITEVRVPENGNQLSILDENLTFYKSQGYDSVLVAFGKNDKVTDVLNVVKYIIKNHGMKVWFTYTGDEKLKESVFIDPDEYTKILTEVAPYASGFINSWRRTSAHLWQQDDVWKKYTNYILRKSNPNIPIVGQLYYGNTHKYHHKNDVGFGLNMFKNASACMIVNFGYRRIDMDYLFNTILKPYLKDVPKIGMVVGQRPYYLTLNKNGLDYKQNLKIKQEIENKFINHGCIGTITLSDDGRKMETNNLSSTSYKSLGN